MYIRFTKEFKVGKVVDHDDYQIYILISVDGCYWQVLRLKSLPGAPWKLGKVVPVPMQLITSARTGDRWYSPVWQLVKADQAIRVDLANPYEWVEFVWGREVALKFFSPPASRTG